jgi:hypothetical protein
MPIPAAARAGCWTPTTRRTRRGPNKTKPHACAGRERRNIGVNSARPGAEGPMRLARRAGAIEENPAGIASGTRRCGWRQQTMRRC